MIDAEDIEALANAELKKHGLARQGWTFKFDSARARAGQCDYDACVISISKHTLKAWSRKQVHNIILHEVAHALVGHEHGHDEVWRARALSIGCDGKRCARGAFCPPKWRVTCGCGKIDFTRLSLQRKLLDRYCCGTCNGRLQACKA